MTVEKSPHPSPANSKFSIGGALKSARYLGILAGLLALGWYGHRTHWTFQTSSHSESGNHAKLAEHAHSVDSLTAAKIESDEAVADDWIITFPSERSLELSGIKTITVEQKPICERVRTTGVVTYDERRSASLSARTTGTVWQVCKHVGESVNKGDVLVIIDAAEVGQTKAEFLSALVSVESKEEICSNLESLAQGSIPIRQIREARVSLREARIQLLNAEQHLVNLGFSVRSEDFEKLGDVERSNRIQFLGLPDALVETLDRDKTTSNLLPIRAAFDAVVLRHDIATGETAEAGKPILEIADTRRMWLKLDVPKEDAPKLTLGQHVTFIPDGLEKEFEASITWISTEMNEQTRTLQVRAEVDNPVVSTDPKSGQEVRLLRANTFGTGTVIVKKSDSALVVPVSSILHDDRQPLVFVRTAELKFERMNVRIGVRDGREVEIQAPELKPGAEIVSRGGHTLKSEWTLHHVASAGP